MFSSNEQPIPVIKPITGWKDLPIRENGEPLVPLGPFLSRNPAEGFIAGQPDAGFSTKIFQDAIYWGERRNSPYRRDELTGALLTPFAREGVARQLTQAASLLPPAHGLLIWDAFRPLSVQGALYDDFHQQLQQKRGLPPTEATTEAQRFVSLPSADPRKPSPHNTGAAIDVTIVKFDPAVLHELTAANRLLHAKDWRQQYAGEMTRLRLLREHSQPLDMGTAFDAVQPQTATRFYEEKLASGEKLSAEETARLNNRRLLFNVMRRAGLSNYGEEWWHFDSGNQFDAARTGKPAVYGTANYSAACAQWETMRLAHQTGSELWRQTAPEVTRNHPDAVVALVAATARRSGSFQASCHQRADRLEA